MFPNESTLVATPHAPPPSQAVVSTELYLTSGPSGGGRASSSRFERHERRHSRTRKNKLFTLLSFSHSKHLQDTASLDSIGTGERPQHNDQTPSSPASSTSEQPNSRPNSGLQVSTTAAVVATTGPATGLAAPGRQTTLPYDEALGPLPPGWSQQVAQTGRLFFIDHNNRITTWVDPRTNKPTPSPQSQTRHGGGESALKGDHKLSNTADIGPLPPGWEERVHRDGRIFFIDHSMFGAQPIDCEC